MCTLFFMEKAYIGTACCIIHVCNIFTLYKAISRIIFFCLNDLHVGLSEIVVDSPNLGVFLHRPDSNRTDYKYKNVCSVIQTFY